MKDEIILKIMELEEQVEKITEEANLQRENLPQVIQNQCAKIEKKLKHEYEENVKKAIEAIKKESADKINDLNKEKINRIESMNKNFNESHTKWENEMFASIKGRVENSIN